MENKEIKLSVRDLVISFKTAAGNVQAVRDISFDLYKGETLAIVGESGSGKSVTTRAILGILANNAVKEGGEIVYDGQDLMKISEESFHKIRGDKIAMIFQDPLSSLNPIMRIGKQMTEAMLIKGKLSRRESRKDFNATLNRINRYMDLSIEADKDSAVKAENQAKCRNFDKFEYKHLDLENEYNVAKEAAQDVLSDTKDLLFEIEKSAVSDIYAETADIIRLARKSISRYVVHARAEELERALAQLKKLASRSPKEYLKTTLRKYVSKNKKRIDGAEYKEFVEPLSRIKAIMEEAVKYVQPNFFALGYYLTFAADPLPEMDVEQLNIFLRKYLDDHFMLGFIASAKKALEYSRNESLHNKETALRVIDENLSVFEKETLDRKEVLKAAGTIISAVEKAIDRLEIVKDNTAYTFGTSIKSAIDLYFDGIKRNKKEERRYARQKANYDARVRKGKTPDWQVAERNLVDLKAAAHDIRMLVRRVRDGYASDIGLGLGIDFTQKTVAVIDYLKEKASNVAFKLTRHIAKARAIKLLEEVGIAEPKKRYRQYPFEFSGGMRQRIVIAIALSENPDILICDEPTTALDVTIQAQILELINKVKEERKLSVIFITHDLGVVANMADRIAVMYAGKIVEIGTSEDIFYAPCHPYTWALLSSMPDLDTKEKLEAIPGTPPNMIYPPKGDAFAERNKYAMQIDFEEQPPMFKVSDTHQAATWLLHPSAPKVNPPKSVTDRIARMRTRVRRAEKESAVFATPDHPDPAEDFPLEAEEGMLRAAEEECVVIPKSVAFPADNLMGANGELAVEEASDRFEEKDIAAIDLGERKKLMEALEAEKKIDENVDSKNDKR